MAPLGGNNMGKFGFAALDVQGYNYADPAADAFHKANPKVPVMGTEQVSAVATRGIYKMDPDTATCGSYDPYTTTGRASCEGWWSFCNARPWLAGGFIWTGFDYRGEPSPYGWPNISSQYGIIDICGFPKDSFFYFQSWWTGKPVLHLFPHWNWPGHGRAGNRRLGAFQPGPRGAVPQRPEPGRQGHEEGFAPGLEREVRSRHDRGARIQRRPAGDDGEARDHRAGGQVGAHAPTAARSRPMAKTWRCSRWKCRTRRAAPVPTADNPVAFRLAGAGRIMGTGNGDPTNQEPDGGSSRKAFNGLAMALVQSGKSAGSITVEASSPGLTLFCHHFIDSRRSCAHRLPHGSARFPPAAASPACGAEARRFSPSARRAARSAVR